MVDAGASGPRAADVSVGRDRYPAIGDAFGADAQLRPDESGLRFVESLPAVVADLFVGVGDVCPEGRCDGGGKS